MTKTVLYSVSKSDLKHFALEIIKEVKGVSTQNFQGIEPNSEDDRLSQKEAAKYIGKSVTTIIEYKKKKLIPFHKIGRSVFYYKSEIIEATRKGLIPK